jgi:transposase InsO family protein
MDVITGLPNVDGYDNILTVVCTLSKIAHFIPCNSTVNSRQLAKLFLDNVHRLHGLPRFLIGDRDTRYTSIFFKNLMSELKTTLCLSTAYHPQSDGNTERCHRTIEQNLRAFVHTDHFNWLSSLSLADYDYNKQRA